jgi:hypothetical protein
MNRNILGSLLRKFSNTRILPYAIIRAVLAKPKHEYVIVSVVVDRFLQTRRPAFPLPDFIAGAGGLASPLATRAQQGQQGQRLRQVGILM